MSRRSGRSRQLDSRSDQENSADEEQDEVTRCVCGNDEISDINQSLQTLLQSEYGIKIETDLFIQCETCSVWQHGYCVGLFTNNDVPEKYWCEECKPDLHKVIKKGKISRTLYLPVNKLRLRLLETADENFSDGKPDTRSSRSRSARRSPNDTPDPNSRDLDSATGPLTLSRQLRKDRRRHDDVFDEQLQKALRESVKAAEPDRKRPAEAPPSSSDAPKRLQTDELGIEVEELNADEEAESRRRAAKPRPKLRPKPKLRLQAPSARASTPKSEAAPQISNEELLNQPLRPRHVNPKLSIYELRKRTGAILEWLGRTQMELEEERDTKSAQFSAAQVAVSLQVFRFDENLKMMENLTEKILLWEQKYGKYAP